MTKQTSKNEVLALIQNIIRYCEAKKRSGSYAFPVDQVFNRVVAITGKTMSTISRIRKALIHAEEPQIPTSSTSSQLLSTVRSQEPTTVKKRRKYIWMMQISKFYINYAL